MPVSFGYKIEIYESPPEYQGNLEMELIWRVLTTTVDHVV